MGVRSRAAAQILAGQGFRTVYNLRGGLKAWKGPAAAGAAEMGLRLLKGNARPVEILSLAYAMEEALSGFYASHAEVIDDPDVSALLGQLAAIETTHKKRLFGLYQSFEPSPVDKESFESHNVSTIVEGGFSTDELKAQHRSAFQTTAGLLNLAMMLEAQAMDYYLRWAQKSVDLEVKKILYQTADDEKGHLNALSALLEKKI